MIFRLLFLLFLCLASSISAGDFFEKWKPGQTEELKYEIKTFLPKVTTSYQNVKITRDTENENIINVYLKLDIPSTSTIIRSMEKYNISDLKLVESLNYFKLPPGSKESIGTDSIAHKAFPEGDSLIIAARDNKMVVPGKIYFPSNTVTTTSSTVLSRAGDFAIGQSRSYKFINLLKITGKQFELADITDSITAIVEVDTPLGKMECYQIMNIVAGGFGYTYFTTDERHLPVKVELMDPESPDKPAMTILLTEVK